jgi:hypothetical protein
MMNIDTPLRDIPEVYTRDTKMNGVFEAQAVENKIM